MASMHAEVVGVTGVFEESGAAEISSDVAPPAKRPTLLEYLCDPVGDEGRRTKYCILLSLSTLAISAALVLEAFLNDKGYLAVGVAGVCAVICGAVPLALIMIHKNGDWLLSATSVGCTVCSIAMDAVNAGLLDDWLLAVVSVRLLTIGRCSKAVVAASTVLIVLWVMLKSVEESVHFGLYDLSSSVEGKYPSREEGTTMHLMVVRLVALLVPHHMLLSVVCGRDLSDQALEKLDTALSEIASSLIQFDTAQAEQALATACQLKAHTHLTDIINNLKLYRPFIPEALFDKDRNTLGGSPRGRHSTLCTEARALENSANTLRSPSSASMWCSLEGLERARASSLHTRQRASIFESLPPKMVRDPGLDRKLESVMCISVEHILENLPDDELASAISDFLDPVIPVVKGNTGRILSFDGCSVIASFVQAPSACRCAMSIRATLRPFVRKWGLDRKRGVHIGIACGPCFCGSVGTECFMVFAALGPAVSQARQVALLCKELSTSTNILCHSTVQIRVVHEVDIRPLQIPKEVEASIGTIFQIVDEMSTGILGRPDFRPSRNTLGYSRRSDPDSHKVVEDEWLNEGHAEAKSLWRFGNRLPDDGSATPEGRHSRTTSGILTRERSRPESTMTKKEAPDTLHLEEPVQFFLRHLEQLDTPIHDVLLLTDSGTLDFVRTVLKGYNPACIDTVMAWLRIQKAEAYSRETSLVSRPCDSDTQSLSSLPPSSHIMRPLTGIDEALSACTNPLNTKFIRGSECADDEFPSPAMANPLYSPNQCRLISTTLPKTTWSITHAAKYQQPDNTSKQLMELVQEEMGGELE